MQIKKRPIEAVTCWSVILLLLSGCSGVFECFGYSQKRLKEICEGRTVELQPNTDSAYQAILKKCLEGIESESAGAIKARVQYISIIDKASRDKFLRKEYESEKSDWEANEAQQAKGWQSDPEYTGHRGNKGDSEYNLEGTPLRDFVKSATYSSYAAWLERARLKKEIEATGWNSIASDMKVFAEEAKCKE